MRLTIFCDLQFIPKAILVQILFPIIPNLMNNTYVISYCVAFYFFMLLINSSFFTNPYFCYKQTATNSSFGILKGLTSGLEFWYKH